MTLFDKTARGREEIATRGHALAPRLRTLLLLVDGKTESDIVLGKVAGLGLSQEHLQTLLEVGMIQLHVQPQVTPTADIGGIATPDPIGNASPAVTQVTMPSPAPLHEAILPPGQTQFEAIYRFYNDTIKSMIGLRGYGLQLKVERASSIEDFKELRQAYLEAILKHKGEEITRSLRDRLDQLLYMVAPASTSARLE